MHSIFTDHHTISFSTSLVIIILGVLLLLIKVPYTIEWRALKQVRVYLAITYFILSIAGFFSSYVETDPDATISDLERAITLVVGSFQALLFMMTNLVFIRSSYVNRRNITLNVASIILVGIVLFLTFAYLPNLFTTVLYIAIGGYCCQLVYFYRLFRKEYKECVQRLEEHYEEDEEERIRWIRNCFYSALCIGILAMVSVTFPISIAVFDAFVLLYTLYYAYVVSTVYNYRNEAHFLLQAISDDLILKESATDNQSAIEVELSIKEEMVDEGEVVLLTEENIKKRKKIVVLSGAELKLDRALRSWVKKKKYLETDVSVDKTVAELGVSLVFFRLYFSTHKSVSFKTWKLGLRIEEAKRILRKDSTISISHLYGTLGFTDRSNFHRHFIQMVGESPLQYRKSHVKQETP